MQVALQVAQGKFEAAVILHCQNQEEGRVAFRVQRMTTKIMSLAQNPVMGKMAKSFANVNTYVHKGQNVISAKTFNRKDKNTEAQQNQRSCFNPLCSKSA